MCKRGILLQSVHDRLFLNCCRLCVLRVVSKKAPALHAKLGEEMPTSTGFVQLITAHLAQSSVAVLLGACQNRNNEYMMQVSLLAATVYATAQAGTATHAERT